MDGLDAALQLEQPLSQVTDDLALGLGEGIQIGHVLFIDVRQDLSGLFTADRFSEAMMALLIQKGGQFVRREALQMGWCRIRCPESQGCDAVDLAEEVLVVRVLIR